MNKTLIIFLILITKQVSLNAQVNEEYLIKIDDILNFQSSDFKKKIKSDDIATYTTDGIIKVLDNKIRNAEKLKQNYDSITTNTVKLLEDLKIFTYNEIQRLFIATNNLEKTDYKSIFSKENEIFELEMESLRDKQNYIKKLNSWGEAILNLEPSSKILLNKINKLKYNKGIDTAKTTSNILKDFLNGFMPIYTNETEKVKKKLDLEKQKKFDQQTNRFEFINNNLQKKYWGKLYRNTSGR